MPSFRTGALSASRAFFSVPWAAFVGVFLYYVVLTVVAISVEQLPDVAMTAAYLAPPVAYLAVLLARALRLAESVPVEVGPLAMLRLQ